MAKSAEATMVDRPFATACAVKQRLVDMSSRRKPLSTERLSPPSPARLAVSRDDRPFDPAEDHITASADKTVLYLAYGSNLSNETFRGNRGIKPIRQINVQVPSLRLTFDLPGIAYLEPCFANSGTRDEDNDRGRLDEAQEVDEKSPLLSRTRDDTNGYRKDGWHKGLIGVVYEVTAKDYAHIIATEGGGSSYHDILVDCYPFESGDPKTSVPQHPASQPFKAHTLFAPATPPGEDPPPKAGGRFSRPDPSYAQPSARYLKLITDGAAECDLPYEYQDYLHSLRPYSITSPKQRIGQFVFLSIWLPLIAAVFAMGRLFVDEKGRQPAWMREFSGAMFKGAWASYDNFFKDLFGDGERSIPDGGDDSGDEDTAKATAKRMEQSWSWSSHRAGVDGDVEKGPLAT